MIPGPPDGPATGVITGEQPHRATGIACEASCSAGAGGEMAAGGCSQGGDARIRDLGQPAPRRQQDNRENEAESEQPADTPKAIVYPIDPPTCCIVLTRAEATPESMQIGRPARRHPSVQTRTDPDLSADVRR